MASSHLCASLSPEQVDFAHHTIPGTNDNLPDGHISVNQPHSNDNLSQDAIRSLAPDQTISYPSTAVADTEPQTTRRNEPFTPQERRQRRTASERASQAKQKAKLQELFGNGKLVVFRLKPSRKGYVYEMLILGQSAREMAQVACKHLTPTPGAGDALENRLIQLVGCLEHVWGRTLTPEKGNPKGVKSRLKTRLGLLIAEACPAAYLDRKLAPLPEEHYGPMLQKLEALERDFKNKLHFSEREEEEEQETSARQVALLSSRGQM
jgi:hypothetical protein